MNNSQSAEQITQILTIILIIMISILFILCCVYIIIKFKNRENKTSKRNNNSAKKEKNIYDNINNEKQYNKQPIEKFMEFDKVEDNMIIQKNGTRFLMVVQCQGVNYDLMSNVEKTSVEQGFIEFLNTLRHPIQIYVQTRTVNLENSVATYKERLKEIEDKLNKMKFQYQEMVDSEQYTKEQLSKALFEITKQTNLFEYGKDIIYNTEKMSLNRNVLNKQYYIIIPYYSAEAGNSNFDQEEVQNMAFSELYTKAQSIIRTLSSCSVTGKILSSNELVELLYIAYNRDESEVFGLDKAIRAGYDELYSTAPDVLDKKMKAIDKEIEDKAIQLANETVEEVKSEKQRRLIKKEKNMDELIKDMAKLILEENKKYIGEEITKESINKIDGKVQDNSKEKGEKVDVGQEKKRRGRKPKQAI